jgi:hypothetical protein
MLLHDDLEDPAADGGKALPLLLAEGIGRGQGIGDALLMIVILAVKGGSGRRRHDLSSST